MITMCLFFICAILFLKSTFFVGIECKFQCKNVNPWKPRAGTLLSATWVLPNLLLANQILLGNPLTPYPHRKPFAKRQATLNWSSQLCLSLFKVFLGFCGIGWETSRWMGRLINTCLHSHCPSLLPHLDLFFFFFLGPHLRHMEVPRLGVKSEL